MKNDNELWKSYRRGELWAIGMCVHLWKIYTSISRAHTFHKFTMRSRNKINLLFDDGLYKIYKFDRGPQGHKQGNETIEVKINKQDIGK